MPRDERENTMPTDEAIEECLAQYIETALWSSTDDDGVNLDDKYFFQNKDQLGIIKLTTNFVEILELKSALL